MPYHEHLPEATLLVGRFSSRCNACGKECLPSEDAHNSAVGYNASPGDKGCGITWTHVQSTYLGEFMETGVRNLRPDLEFIPIKLPEPPSA
jgi:hypothetical protein